TKQRSITPTRTPPLPLTSENAVITLGKTTASEQSVPSRYGLVGLRERVEALGGHLNAGPYGGGAWRLAARIPHPSIEQNGPLS
ncbi:hypothetical protein ACH4M4_37425, partial [Streptomyces sp. NPDC017254]